MLISDRLLDCSAPLPTPKVVKVGEDASSCRSDYLYAGDIVILQHPVRCVVQEITKQSLPREFSALNPLKTRVRYDRTDSGGAERI